MTLDITAVSKGIDCNLLEIADYPTRRGYTAELSSAGTGKYYIKL